MTTDHPCICSDKRAHLRECLMKLKGQQLKLLNEHKINQFDYRMFLHHLNAIDDCIGLTKDDTKTETN